MRTSKSTKRLAGLDFLSAEQSSNSLLLMVRRVAAAEPCKYIRLQSFSKYMVHSCGNGSFVSKRRIASLLIPVGRPVGEAGCAWKAGSSYLLMGSVPRIGSEHECVGGIQVDANGAVERLYVLSHKVLGLCANHEGRPDYALNAT